MTPGDVWTASAMVLGGSAFAGLLVTLVLRRMLPSAPFVRSWLFYSGLFAFLLGVVLWVGLS